MVSVVISRAFGHVVHEFAGRRIEGSSVGASVVLNQILKEHDIDSEIVVGFTTDDNQRTTQHAWVDIHGLILDPARYINHKVDMAMRGKTHDRSKRRYMRTRDKKLVFFDSGLTASFDTQDKIDAYLLNAPEDIRTFMIRAIRDFSPTVSSDTEYVDKKRLDIATKIITNSIEYKQRQIIAPIFNDIVGFSMKKKWYANCLPLAIILHDTIQERKIKSEIHRGISFGIIFKEAIEHFWVEAAGKRYNPAPIINRYMAQTEEAKQSAMYAIIAKSIDKNVDHLALEREDYILANSDYLKLYQSEPKKFWESSKNHKEEVGKYAYLCRQELIDKYSKKI